MGRKQDHFSRQAKAAGYPARSVYKLEEIQRKYRVMRGGMRILDVGASPGSFSMYAAKIAGSKGFVVGVDLVNSPPPLPESAYEFIHGDAFSPEIAPRLKFLGPFHCILSDAAPSTTGNRVVDTARSANIVESVLHLAENLLAAHGNFVAKIFQGGDEGGLLRVAKAMFQTAKLFKPGASRKESFETFLIGINRR